MLPVDRLQRAGATPQEIAQLQGEYDALSPAGRETTDARYGRVAVGDIIEHLASLRDAGHFAGTPVDPDEDEAGPELAEPLSPADVTAQLAAQLAGNPPA